MQSLKISFSLFSFIVLALLQQNLCQAQNSPQDFVDAHNAVRGQVRVGPITWDENVAAFARNYVNSRLGDCNLVHSSNRPGYGENLAKGSGDFTGRRAVELWAGEKPNYDHDSNSCVGGQCLHYTQVVWRNSVRVGCARARCSNGEWFISCDYAPQGNIIGQRPY